MQIGNLGLGMTFDRGKHLCVQYSETYDWRLSVPNMEKRDSYFTRLKWRIELTHHTEGEKARSCFACSLIVCCQSPGLASGLHVLRDDLIQWVKTPPVSQPKILYFLPTTAMRQCYAGGHLSVDGG